MISQVDWVYIFVSQCTWQFFVWCCFGCFMNILSHDMSVKIANLHGSCINNPTSAVFLGLMLIVHTLNPGLFFLLIFWNIYVTGLCTTISEARWIVGLLQWKMVSKSQNFNFQSERLLVFFCLIQNGPVVIWVACIDIRESYKWSFRSARAYSEAFLSFSKSWDTKSSCKYTIPKKSWNLYQNLPYKPSWPP